MVGVPASRACDECRRVRKKCDTRAPCARCVRLNIPCIGLGQRRFKWVTNDQNRPSDGNDDQDDYRVNRAWLSTRHRSRPLFSSDHPSRTLSNDFTIFLGAFAATISPTTHIKYQLPWNFGDYLQEIPCRLGSSKALDAASDALIAAYSRFCCNHTELGLEPVKKYTAALRELKISLDDPVKAHSSETLAAINLLQIYQLLSGTQDSSRHSAGAAQILKSRGCTGPKNSFESKILVSMRGPIIFEGLSNPQINFTDQEWEDLIEPPKAARGTPDQTMVYCFGRAPYLMSRLKAARNTPNTPPSTIRNLTVEGHALRNTARSTLEILHTRLLNIDQETVKHPHILHAHYTRMYTLGLAIVIILNCILDEFSDNFWELRDESAAFAQDIADMADEIEPYRPLGSAWIIMCLSIAWMGARDRRSRSRIEELYLDFLCDISRLCGNANLIATGSPFDLLKKNDMFQRFIGA